MPLRLTGFFAALLAACAPPAPSAAPATTAPIAPRAAASTATPLPAGAVRITVVAERSVATVRVREQIADVPLPGDAVLTARGFHGGLILSADGAFAPGSSISIGLDALHSDNALRDEWIKINTLQTRRFPEAELIAHRVTGIPIPLPATGEWHAQVQATMRVHGVDRDLTWPLVVTRTAGEVRATGTTSFTFGDHGMAVPANRMILSVVDDVRLEVDIVASVE